MRSLESFSGIYIHREPVDMRKSFTGLSAIVSEQMSGDFQRAHLFVFTNRRRNLMKVIYFDDSGFALWMKRLESSKFPWPRRLSDSVIEVSSDDMELLLQGINIWTRFEKVCFERVV